VGQDGHLHAQALFQDNGSGMHTHQSIWKNGKNLFYERGGYADISKNCLYYIGGILKHAPALLALIAPSTNSYKRLVPGYEAPINLVYSQRNRSACIRIPMYSKSEGAKRIEFRTPDPTCNPYLSFSACLMAGLDGIANKIDPGKPVDKDLYELPPAEAKKIKQLPGDLSIVLDNLEKSHDWLLKGDVFTPDVIETWIEYKRKNEVDPVRAAPAPVRVRALLRHLTAGATPWPLPLRSHGPGFPGRASPFDIRRVKKMLTKQARSPRCPPLQQPPREQLDATLRQH